MRSLTLDPGSALDRIELEDVAGADGLLFVRDRVGFAGRRVAARWAADEAVARLSAVEHRDESGIGRGPVALGCLPFRPGAPAELVVPEVLVSRDRTGRTTVTVTSDGRLPDPDTVMNELTAPIAAIPTRSADYSVRPASPVTVHRDAVLAVRDAVRAGRLTKAVIARAVDVESSEPWDVGGVLRRLRGSFGSSHRYSIDGFIGASPELLVEVDDDIVASHPLAGTTPRTGDPATDDRLAEALVGSMKDQIEHRVVIDVVHDTLLPWCSYLDWEPEPSIVRVANVQHLGTRIEGRLSDPRPDVMTLVRALSPTPALGGHPRKEALELIEAVEGFDRGLYGGAVGWTDSAGNGTWAVAIRCAILSDDRRRARLMAGGGIVADSDPDAELAETQAKFQAMLSALVRA